MANATQIGDWFAGVFTTNTPGVVEVTVRSVNPDTSALIAESTGVRAYKKGGASDELGASRSKTCQWRLLREDIDFEPEPLHHVIEADGTTWQIQPETPVASEVYGRYRVCQCAEIVAG